MSETRNARPRLTLIAAMDRGGMIGADGGMPWHIPEDLRWFKRHTQDKPILMGRRTFDSIGRPLPRRRNLVLTRDTAFVVAGCERIASVEQALETVCAVHELMVIGGAQVYALTLPLASRLLITRIEADYPGDTRFPSIDWDDWQLENTKRHAAAGDTPAYRFMTYHRRSG